MILYRAEENRILELLRNLALEKIIPVTQRAVRAAIGFKYRVRLRDCRARMELALNNSTSIQDVDRELSRYENMVGPMEVLFRFQPPEVARMYDLRHKLQEREELTPILNALLNKDPDRNYVEFADAIYRLDLIKDVPATNDQIKLERTIRAKMKKCVGKRLDQLAVQALDIVNLAAMREVMSLCRLWNFDPKIRYSAKQGSLVTKVNGLMT